MPRPSKQINTKSDAGGQYETPQTGKERDTLENSGDISHVEAWLRVYGLSVLFICILAIVIIDIFEIIYLSISWTTIALIAMLMIIPYLRDLKRVEVANMGSVELQSDIESARQRVEQLGTGFNQRAEPTGHTDEESSEDDAGVSEPSARPETQLDTGEKEQQDTDSYGDEVEPAGQHYGGYVGGIGGDTDSISGEIYYFLDRNPRVALAKLRRALEEEIRKTVEKHDESETSSQNHNYRSPLQAAEALVELGLVDDKFIHSYYQVRNLCNKAIHGEEVRTQDAIDIVDLGLDLLRYVKKTDPKGSDSTD